MATGRFGLEPFCNMGGAVVWRVAGMLNGLNERRIRKNLRPRAEATATVHPRNRPFSGRIAVWEAEWLPFRVQRA